MALLSQGSKNKDRCDFVLLAPAPFQDTGCQSLEVDFLGQLSCELADIWLLALEKVDVSWGPEGRPYPTPPARSLHSLPGLPGTTGRQGVGDVPHLSCVPEQARQGVKSSTGPQSGPCLLPPRSMHMPISPVPAGGPQEFLPH